MHFKGVLQNEYNQKQKFQLNDIEIRFPLNQIWA